MGHSQTEKAASRARILEAAAGQVREGGLESVSVGKLMNSVDLTHGGFYNHFGSRSDLLAEALEKALQEGANAARGPTLKRGRSTFASFVRSYLSKTHRESRRTGCAIPALVTDVGRADVASRAVMERHVEDYIGTTMRSLGDADEGRAMVAISAMVGALALSRVFTNEKRSDALLQSVRDYLVNFEGGA